jgi:hypothetical protein
MSHTKVTILLAAVFGLFVGCAEVEPVKEEVELDGWADYVNFDEGFQYKYPDELLILEETDSSTSLHHALQLSDGYAQSCATVFEQAKQSTELIDFEMVIAIFDGNLKEAALHYEQADYTPDDFTLDEDTGKISGGPLQEVNIAAFHLGYSSYEGAEMCGLNRYYFPLASNKILVIERAVITELTEYGFNQKLFLSLPDVILPDEEEELFLQILSTFELIN